MISESPRDPLPVGMAISGELTIYTAAEWRQKLAALPADPPLIELDLADVSEIDTAGLQLLISARKTFSASGRQLHLVRHSTCVRELLEFCRLESHFGDPVVIPA